MDGADLPLTRGLGGPNYGMTPFRARAILPALALTISCSHDRAPAVTDSARLSGPVAVDSAIAASRAQHWDPAAGPVLLVAGDVPARAFLLVPDTANVAAGLAAVPHPASVTLFGRGGTVQTAELPEVPDSGVCAVAMLHAAPPPRAWNIGFVGGVVSPLALDSTESLSSTDSASIVVAVTRLASGLPNDTAGRFAGLPFVVRAIWRFTVPSGPVAVVANLVRQINQEATPLQERTLVIAEHVAGDTTWNMSYSERSYGDEETIESRDLLGAALLGAQRTPALVLLRDFGDATSYALLERNATGQWQVQWSSPRRHC